MWIVGRILRLLDQTGQHQCVCVVNSADSAITLRSALCSNWHSLLLQPTQMWLLALLIPLSGMCFHLCCDVCGVLGSACVVCWGQHVWCVGVSMCGVLGSVVWCVGVSGVVCWGQRCGVLGSAVFPSDCSIYAIGDCIHGPMLAHKAEDEGEWPM